MTLVDIDGDGHLDLLLAVHGMPGFAGKNDGQGHFTWVDPRLGFPPEPPGDSLPRRRSPAMVYDLNEDGQTEIFWPATEMVRA